MSLSLHHLFLGSTSETCNLYTGQCDCKPGFGGRQCDQCEAGYWGDPRRECIACNCNPSGVDPNKTQCDSETGRCFCLEGNYRVMSEQVCFNTLTIFLCFRVKITRFISFSSSAWLFQLSNKVDKWCFRDLIFKETKASLLHDKPIKSVDHWSVKQFSLSRYWRREVWWVCSWSCSGYSNISWSPCSNQIHPIKSGD